MQQIGKPKRAINEYTPEILENNWVEERHDLKYLRESKPLPSQFDHYYSTTYKTSTKNVDANPLNYPAKNAVESSTLRNPAFPGHQPEMDEDLLKERLNTYETDHRVNYIDPRLRLFPFDLKQMLTSNSAAPAPIVKLQE